MIKPFEGACGFSHVTFLCVITLLPLCGCGHTQVSTCPIPAKDVLQDLDITNMNHTKVVAWTPDFRNVVVMGRRGSKHSVIVAFRDINLTASRWVLGEIQLMFRDGTSQWCEWIVGDRDYEHLPTREDILMFLNVLNPGGVVDDEDYERPSTRSDVIELFGELYYVSEMVKEVYVFREDVK